MTFSLKQKIIGGVIILGIILIAIFKVGLEGISNSIFNSSKEKVQQADNGGPALISSTPPELFDKKPLIFRPDQVIELHFNDKLENGPETKIVLDPPVEFKIEVINDNKTAKITPVTTFKLGQGYTIFVKPETKIQGGKTLGKSYDMQFNVINYSGI